MPSINQIKYGSIFILIFSFLLFKFQFHFSILSTILSIIFIFILLILYGLYEFSKIMKGAGYSEEWHDLYGDKILNIPYFTKYNKIINSFKKDGINYIEELGEINEGKDYEKNDRNYYDLFIPYITLKRKDKYNGIFLFIHGGGWQALKKEYISHCSIRYAKYGYITAQMNHTLLAKNNKQNSIFKILDEINACLDNIKLQLKKLGFDENKLELAIGGASSGAHLSLLYGYYMKNIPIPLKFIINVCGPLSLENKYWYKLGKNIPALDNIENINIDELIKENKIVEMFNNEYAILNLMNKFIGNKYSNKELKQMINGKKINKGNEKYLELNNKAKYCYPINFINENSAPTLCLYGGEDSTVGIVHYFYLKKIAEKFGNKVELIYMKNGGHFLADYKSKNGMNAIREMNYKILYYAKTYFTYDD